MQPNENNRWRLHLARLGLAALGLALAWLAWRLVPEVPRATLPEGCEVIGLSPDGAVLVARREGRPGFWDTTTGQPLGQVADSVGGIPSAFRFSPAGDLLACTAEGVVKVWEVPGGRE